MGKRSFSILLALALVAGVFSALPAKAQEAPPQPTEVPAAPHIVDPEGDGNYLNDQSVAAQVAGNVVKPETGDHTGPVTVAAGDILAVWFTQTTDTISVHVQTVGPAPGLQGQSAFIYRVIVNPEEDIFGMGCQWFQGVVGGPSNDGESYANYRDTCAEATILGDGTIAVSTMADGTGLTSMTYPKDIHATLANGVTLSKPWAQSRHVTPAATAPQVDHTKIGLDFLISSSSGSVVTEDEPKEEKKGKAKGKKAKKPKKKKKAKKPKKPPADVCPAYVPGEEGAEAETSVVTDAATAEAPVTFELTAGPGGPNQPPVPLDLRSHSYHNIQVDSAAPSAGLYVKIEFPDRHDYDLWLNNPDGTEADHSADFNTPYEAGLFSCGGTSCEAGSNYESVLGINTADCAGYTAHIAGFLSTGGTVTVSMWLGEGLADPGSGAADASALFYELMGI